MSKDELARLERQWRLSEDADDERRWFLERLRLGELQQRYEAVLDQFKSDIAEHDEIPCEPNGLPWQLVFELFEFESEDLQSEPLATLEAALKRRGYKGRVNAYRELDRSEALALLSRRCHVTEAYGEVMVPRERAEAAARDLLALLPTTAQIYTNVSDSWNTSAFSWSAGLTGHTMDTGLIAHGGVFLLVLWFRDED